MSTQTHTHTHTHTHAHTHTHTHMHTRTHVLAHTHTHFPVQIYAYFLLPVEAAMARSGVNVRPASVSQWLESKVCVFYVFYICGIANM